MSSYPFELIDPRLDPVCPIYISLNTIERHFPQHRHDFLEISLVAEGAGEETVNGIVHPMLPGTMTVVLPFHIHELRSGPAQALKLYNCSFGAELMSDRGELEELKEKLLGGDMGRSPFMQLSAGEMEPMLRIFRDLHHEYGQLRGMRTAMLKAKLAELMITAERLRSRLPEEAKPARGEKPERIWMVLRHMHGHYREELTLGGLADAFHVNRTYLSEEIKRHTGKSFVALLHEIRLRHACSLLTSSTMTIPAIAYEAGYGSAQTLFKAFQKYKGVTPGEYRSRAGS